MNKFENFQNRTIKRATLPNGMKCCFINDQNQGDVGFTLSIGGGTESEPEDLSGIASFCLQSIFAGSLMYPGTKNFKDFITDNEVSCSSVSFLSSVRLESIVPEFALEEFLQRVLEALESPELSPEALEYVIEKRLSSFHSNMHNARCRLTQIRTMVMSESKIWGTNCGQLFEKKNLQLLVEEYYSKYFKPSNMSLSMVSSLSLEQQYEFIMKTLGFLNCKSEPPMNACPLEYNHRCRDGEVMLTRAFTMNPKAKMLVSCHLPKETSVSSSLYLGFLFLKSDPGSLNYHLKNEGLITGITVEHIYWKKSLQTLDIIIAQTEEGAEKAEEILSVFMAYMELIKTHKPSKRLFDQSRQYFLNMRVQENTYDFLDKVNALHNDSERFDLCPNDEDLLFPDVPRCFDPFDITKTMRALNPSDFMVFALSDKFVHTQMHPRTDIYLQFSSELIKIVPCFDKLCSPKPSIINVSDENFATSTSEVELMHVDPAILVKTISSQTRAILRLKILSTNLAVFPPSIQRVYASMIDHKMWLLSDGATFSFKAKAEHNALIVEINSFPTALARVFSVLVQILKTPIENEYLGVLLKKKDEELERLESFLSGSKSVDQQLYTELFLERNYDFKSMIVALQKVNSVDDLPRHVEGTASLLLCGKINRPIISAISTVVKKLMDPRFDFLNASYSKLRQVVNSGLCVEKSQGPLERLVPIKTNKEYSVCLKRIGVGVFSYPTWCQAVLFAEILNLVVIPELKICINPTVIFSAKPINTRGNIEILISASYKVSGVVLEETLSNCVFICLRNYMSKPNECMVANVRAKCANQFLTTKGDLQCEMSRLWEPISHGLPVKEYFTCFQENLWKTSMTDLTEFCSNLVLNDAIYNAHTSIFLSAIDFEISRKLVLDIELPLLRLYQPVAYFDRHSVLESVKDTNSFVKRWSSARTEEEQGYYFSQLKEALLTLNRLDALSRVLRN